MKKTVFAIMMAMTVGAMAQNNVETEQMLDRFLSYIKIESQSTYPDDPAKEFPINEGQKEIAEFIYNEVRSFGDGVDVKLSPDYYLYIKIPTNSKRKLPSICFMAHMDVSPEVNGTGIRPQVIRDYKGGDIPLGTSGLTLSPDSTLGAHLKDVVGHTVVTSSGNSNIGADDKTGCAVLVSMVQQLLQNNSFERPDVYIILTQNEDVGMAAYRLDLAYLEKIPDIMIDVDGGESGYYSVSNFSAKGYTYQFCGNKRHPSNGKEVGLVDAHTAMCYFIGQLPPDVNPMFSDGRQGYLQAYIFDNLENGSYRVKFRMRYFEKSDSAYYAQCLAKAEEQTLKAFPGLQIKIEAAYLQYENVAYSMHPQTIPLIERAALQCGMKLEKEEIRAGTTGAMIVARGLGLPGAPCLYSGQNAEHTVYEWCSINELVEITQLCLRIVEEVAKL